MDQHDMDGPGVFGSDAYGPDADHGFDATGHEFGLDDAGLDDTSPHGGDAYGSDRYEMGHSDPRHADGFDPDGFDPELADVDTTDLSFAVDYGGADDFGDAPAGQMIANAEAPEGYERPDGYDSHLPIGYGELWADQSGLYPLSALAAGMEVPFGADPDLCPGAGGELSVDLDPGEDFRYPPGIDLPEPVGGYPWVDPAVLGHDLLPPLGDVGGVPAPDELFEYAGEQPPDGGDAWAFLMDSPDPATSALARWWST